MGEKFQEMAAKWPSVWVARTQAEAFTGGIVSERYLANLDSKGLGPSGRVRFGRKVAYPIGEFISWLERRSAAIPDREK